MQLGVFDLFRPGIGPSSSHTVGPMRAGHHFATMLADEGLNPRALTVDLYGSLAATGVGHGTDRAVLLGLGGAVPETVPMETVDALLADLEATGVLNLIGTGVPFDFARDLRFFPGRSLPGHVNGLTITADLGEGTAPASRTYYSTGGGFVSIEDEDGGLRPLTEAEGEGEAGKCPHPFRSALELLDSCSAGDLSVAEAARRNQLATRPEAQLHEHLDLVLRTMFQGIASGCTSEGTLPGGLGVPRRAAALRRKLEQVPSDPLGLLDWVTLYALAVNEENAAGHRVVTAPTNGAAGVVPAVMGHYLVSRAADKSGGLPQLAARVPLWDLNTVLEQFPELRRSAHDFLLAAAAIGSLIKTNASIAGAEVGCQGEIGSASAMAAAGLAQAMGGAPAQVENAAEIAMEHSLGLTCDPVGGLVQIPCIERNAIGAVKAISAARMALYGDGRHQVSLDVAIETMRQTGADMNAKYKETSVGGLAVNVVEC